MSLRAARPRALRAAPPFPMMIPFCVSLSTMISALMKSLFSRSSYSITLTVEAYGTSWRYCRKSCSRTISAMKNRSGCSLSTSLGYRDGPNGSLLEIHFWSCSTLMFAFAEICTTESATGHSFLYQANSESASCLERRSHLLSTITIGQPFLRRLSGSSPFNASLGVLPAASIMTTITSASFTDVLTLFIMKFSILLRSVSTTPGVSRRII
mmetsp:Transcript_3870/g.7987  ORF Transcript_3870/g.7987 Transcript_3870/m.7987 type:complete len:211 (+) Transcript_3870:469-1101(+)